MVHFYRALAHGLMDFSPINWILDAGHKVPLGQRPFSGCSILVVIKRGSRIDEIPPFREDSRSLWSPCPVKDRRSNWAGESKGEEIERGIF